MPAVVRSEFALALNQVATERGIDVEVVLDTIKAAIMAAYRKDFGPDDLEEISVEINSNTGEAKILKEKKDITPAGFGRIAAQTAKQVILQRIREAEKQAILSDYATKVGSIVSGMVLRFDGPNVIVDIGKAEGVMPPNAQIPTERYRLNQRLIVYIEGIRESHRGNEIVVSRASKGLIEGLFHREVPEVANGAVDIKLVAREPGFRSKVAVVSTQPGVDPVGSCVGQKGVRVQAVIAELGGMEKIDIIQWHEDSRQFITAALSPAKDIELVLNEEKQSAVALIADDQLSLAIGKEGQNVRLAAKLTGWKIDIKGKNESEVSKEKEEKETKVAQEKETKKEKEKPAKKTKKKKKEEKGTNEKLSASSTDVATQTPTPDPEKEKESKTSTEDQQ